MCYVNERTSYWKRKTEAALDAGNGRWLYKCKSSVLLSVIADGNLISKFNKTWCGTAKTSWELAQEWKMGIAVVVVVGVYVKRKSFECLSRRLGFVMRRHCSIECGAQPLNNNVRRAKSIAETNDAFPLFKSPPPHPSFSRRRPG